ncbi:MAG: HEAT repeat domain-containing protein [Myxococcales bacterium]|nr:HEAT repeat domain-containing protein [Myxococcales bacterium]
MLVVTAGLMAACPSPSRAQDTTKLARVLDSARDFRLRVRAAVALGHLGVVESAPALEAALHDSHPAVRAAAASALGQIGATRALEALANAQRDRAPAVRRAASQATDAIERRARQNATASLDLAVVPSKVRDEKVAWARIDRVVVVGDVHSSAHYQDARMTMLLREQIAGALREIPSTWVVTDPGMLESGAMREIERRELPLLRVEGHIKGFRRKLEGSTVAVRAELSVFLLDARQQSLRAEMRGAATTREALRGAAYRQNLSLAGRALAAAVTGALANAERAFVVAAKN